MFSGLESRVVDIVDSFGYFGISTLIIAETVFPPIPSEIILPLAGFTASQGDLTLPGVLIAATIGSIIGALILYGFGLLIGRERLIALTNRYGRYFLIKEDDIIRAEAWFTRHQGKAVIIGRLVPGVRSVISLPAGVTRMPLPAFIGYTAIGSLLWNTLLVGAGYQLGNHWDRVAGVVSWAQYVVIALILLAALWFVWSRRNEWRVWLPGGRR